MNIVPLGENTIKIKYIKVTLNNKRIFNKNNKKSEYLKETMQNKEKDEEIFGPRSLVKNAQCM